jgi:hypothetical protein
MAKWDILKNQNIGYFYKTKERIIMSENKREPGFYRVKTKDKKWIIAKWNGNYWWKVESIINRYDSDFAEIDETPISAEPSNPEPTREELVEKVEQFLVGKSLMEYLPEIMVDIYLEMKNGK